jgi:hypothetical protein
MPFSDAAIVTMAFHVFDIFHTPPFMPLAADPAAIDLIAAERYFRLCHCCPLRAPFC